MQSSHWAHPPAKVPLYMPQNRQYIYGNPSQSQPNSRLGAEAVRILRAEFARHDKPQANFKQELANRFGVPKGKIDNWYQNERAKTKNQKKQAEQKRQAGEEPETQDSRRPSTASSASPPVSTQASDLPFRATQLPTLRSNSSNELQYTATDLQHFPVQSVQYANHNIHNGMSMMSAPAHITTFSHQIQAPQSYNHSPQLTTWMEPPQSTPEAFQTEALPQFSLPTPTLGTSLLDSMPTNLTWQTDYLDMTPTGNSFDDLNQFTATNYEAPMPNYEVPLLSAHIDGGFPMSVQPNELFYPEHSSWPPVTLPQLSPSESHHEQGLESLPMTPASFTATEPYVSVDQSDDAFLFSDIFTHVSSVSSNMGDEFPPSDFAEGPSRPSSTQPSSFSKKRGVNLQHLNLGTPTMAIGNGSLRLPQSAGVRAPRSPLLPIRDDSRRVSKASVRPSGQITPR